MEDAFSNAVGIPALDNPTPFWINPLDLPRSEEYALLQNLREQKPKTEMQLLSTREYKPQSGHIQRNRRSSKPHISRDGIDPERARHLERNRVAASKCRFKRKEEHMRLLSTLDSEIAKRKTLLAKVNALKEEIWHIKNRMFEHAGVCGRKQISLQLAVMAQNKPIGARFDAMQCLSPTFLPSMWLDGSASEGDLRDVGSESLGDVADPARQDFPDGLFDRAVDKPCT